MNSEYIYPALSNKPEPKARWSFRPPVRVIAGAVVIALIAGGTLTAGTLKVQDSAAHEASAQANELALFSELADFRRDEAAAVASIEAADASILAAQDALARSEGKTLDEAARTSLQIKIALAVMDRSVAVDRLEKQRGVRLHLLADENLDFSKAAFILNAMPRITIAPSFEAEIAAVDDAVAVWEVEQARLAEQARIEAEQAAAEAAAKARASKPKTSAPKTTAPPSNSVYTKNVWTAGRQAEIDACKGAVDLTAMYDLAVIGEHAGCGGSSFPSTAGTVIKVTGIHAGTYRVLGVAANLPSNGRSSDIPRGYDLLFQVCNSGQGTIKFIALEKIG